LVLKSEKGEVKKWVTRYEKLGLSWDLYQP